jgi:Zn-dependent peptidase ImmA (M78 family)
MGKRLSEIDVFGRTYQIIYVDLTQADNDGSFHYEDDLIQIDQSLVGQALQQTLLHEIFHAVMHRSSLSQAVGPALEEVLVDLIATFLTDHWDFDLS